MSLQKEDQVQREYAYAIVDEVDSVLIDEARTPLIISGAVDAPVDTTFSELKPLIQNLVRKQNELAAQIVKEAQQLMDKGKDSEAGYKLLQALRGAPKHPRVMKIFQESKNKSLEVFGVETRLEQILANLLDNAVSFSPENGSIQVSCLEKEKKVYLVVEDEGPGFNEKNIDRVFDRFYSNRPQKFGEHSGLGLNIVKNIVELHGGSIIASNQLKNKKGARIEVLLPIYK